MHLKNHGSVRAQPSEIEFKSGWWAQQQKYLSNGKDSDSDLDEEYYYDDEDNEEYYDDDDDEFYEEFEKDEKKR